MRVLYLHGFGSGPLSAKAVWLREKLEKSGVSVLVPDLNLPDFEHLRVSLMVERAVRLLEESGPSVVVGSSLGGLVALHAQARSERARGLVLLAPALSPDSRWKQWIGEEGLASWKRSNARLFFNHVSKTERPIDYGFYEDLVALARPPAPRVPVRIVHGRRDEAVPKAASEEFARSHGARLRLVDDDHGLLSHLDLIAREIELALEEARSTAT